MSVFLVEDETAITAQVEYAAEKDALIEFCGPVHHDGEEHVCLKK